MRRCFWNTVGLAVPMWAIIGGVACALAGCDSRERYVRDCVQSEIVAPVLDPEKGYRMCVRYGAWRKAP
jgi:hypothetical protein